MQDESIPQEVVASLLASGFPLQTAVAHLLNALPGCEVIEEEFPWANESGDEQFLDIVAQKSVFTFAIECKKTLKETFTFLLPMSAGKAEEQARALYLSQVKDSTHRMELYGGAWRLTPISVESSFCVVSTSSSGRDSRLLERDAQLLIRGTDAYARQFKKEFKWKTTEEFDRPIIPVLVTNARLFAASYDPAEVSLTTGQFQAPPPADITPIRCARFTKAFTADSRDFGKRTVMVVNTDYLEEWMQRFFFASSKVPDGRSYFQ